MTSNNIPKAASPHDIPAAPKPPAAPEALGASAPNAPTAPAPPDATNPPAAPAAPGAAAPQPPAAPKPPASATAGAPKTAPAAPGNTVPTPPVAPAEPPAAPSAPKAVPAPPAVPGNAAPKPPIAPSAPAAPGGAAPKPPSAPAAPGGAAPKPPSAPAAPGGAAPKPPSAPAAPAAPGGAKPTTTATPAADSTPAAGKPAATEKPAGAKPSAGAKTVGAKPSGAKSPGWRRVAVFGVLTAVVLLALAVMAARAFVNSGPGQDFLARYPGENPLPENAPVGLPAWLGWSHFFNMFLMVLIVKTGWQVRTQRKPDAYWQPKGGGKKISLTLWIHLALDVLWMVNGVIFAVLLFTTGQWMRIVPTSWEVFPNAVSAGLQYLTLDWPTENAWVNYNALQQLAYFVTVFVAAPLAIASGLRMSIWWKNEWTAANKLFPASAARKIHFPVMFYFLVFVVIHVTLVLATGVLRNLNNMYAARGDVNPDVYADNWLGFIIFAVSLAVIAGAWVATKPAVLAPVARRFGEVTAR